MPKVQANAAITCLVAFFIMASCQPQGTNGTDHMQHAHTNRLINETSPYLLQHAHNPVNWWPWSPEAFDSAKAQNKLVLVSIGYSSCHWCHVMERESFENDSVAQIMNEKFICIKVDREERPDVDQVYMTAVQLMTGSGGWPLNCFALPDGKPVYGGTYFPPAQWKQLLNDLQATWTMQPERMRAQAEQVHSGIAGADLVHLNSDPPLFTEKDLRRYVGAWDSSFDHQEGGPDRAPKFPMPNNYRFLLRQAFLTNDAALKAHVALTLDKMALGGIFDQVGGGWSRYSTDVLWKVPHFEKMLYDNAQLVSLYSQGYQAFKDPLYEDAVRRTIGWLQREMTSPEGAFYSALDADSEGEEGKFYVWKDEEVKAALGNDYTLAKDYYNIGGAALWEHGNNILLRKSADDEFAKKHNLTGSELEAAVTRINAALLTARDKRTRPGLDDKSLVSWNALTVTGLCDAYEVFGEEAWLQLADKNMELMLAKCKRPDGGMNHSYKDGKATINGFLEDYAFTAEALCALYSVTFNERYLNDARRLAEYAIAHFHDKSSGMFHFTSDLDPALIARKMETTDNVIPSSNSTMANVLFSLGHLFDNQAWLDMSATMLNNVKDHFTTYPSGYSNWAQLMLAEVHPFHEIAITGPDALKTRSGFAPYYIPNRFFMGSAQASKLPLLEDKLMEGTTIFVCQNKACQLPVTSVEEALKQLK
ncbi:MAG: thioredoxin domain-containing protein [Flavobacteriales bacterium]